MIKIKSKTTLLRILKNNRDQSVILHYQCRICDNQQKSDEEDVKDILDNLETCECIEVGYQCASCGMDILAIQPTDIFGVEIL